MTIHLANGMAAGSAAIDPPVRDVHVSFRVERNVAGAAESGLRCGAAVSEVRTTVARHGLYGGGLLCSVLSTAATASAKREDDECRQQRRPEGVPHHSNLGIDHLLLLFGYLPHSQQ